MILQYNLDNVKVQLETYRAINLGARVILNQGGTRSAKTYGISKLAIGLALKDKYEISITSLSLPHLRKGAMKDWKEIMNNYNLYLQSRHRKTDRAYDYPSGSYIEFFSVDDSLKVRGPSRDILYVNELNLIDFETFLQLLLRTKKCAIGDYNPADEFHWIYDELLTTFVEQDGGIAWYRRKGQDINSKPDVAFIKTTYLDNPFLPKEQTKEIENLKNIDENYWRVYGLGERGHSEGIIYTKWSTYNGEIDGDVAWGLDFGYNNPSALIKVTKKDNNLYWQQKIYQSHLTTQDLIPMIKEHVKPHEKVFCDHENDRITELQRAGIKAIAANKNVSDGILNVKSHNLYCHRDSVEMIKEIKSYKYQEPGKRKANEPETPLKLNDHAMDGGRYGSMGLATTKRFFKSSFHKQTRA